MMLLMVRPAVAQDITVTLLGTGSPPPVMNRFGPATLIEAGGHRFIVDAGRGALQRLAQLTVPWQSIEGVFFTHLHSDHIVGFPDLWLTGWVLGRDRPVRIWGPSGTKSMATHLGAAYAFDIGMRERDQGLPSAGVAIDARDIGEGVALETDGVRITAFLVDHGPIAPALGYRIDYRGRSVVISGDTRVSDNLVKHAGGVDLLLHEVAAPATLARANMSPSRQHQILALHVTPEQAAEVFARTKPKLAVYTHVLQPSATEADVIVPTRATYAGRVELGEDLMVITIGDTVEVKRPARTPGG